MTTGSSPRRNARKDRMIMLGYFDAHSATGVVHDKHSKDQQWLLDQKYLKAEIDHHPPNSDWPRVIVKITELGRTALAEFRHAEPMEATAP
jgi:hypothetical protein